MRRDADSGMWPVVDQDLAAGKLARDFFSIRDIDNHHAATGSRIAAGAHGEACVGGKLDEPLSLPQRFCPNRLDTDLVYDFVA